MDEAMSSANHLSYRRFSDASIASMKTDDSSTVSPLGPSTPANSFSIFSRKKSQPTGHNMITDDPNITHGSAYTYLAELDHASWHLAAEEHLHAEPQDATLGSLGHGGFCSIGDEDQFRFSSFPTEASDELDFTPNLKSSQTISAVEPHGLRGFSPEWSMGSSDNKPTISPTETFHLPDIATCPMIGFDQVSWGLPTEASCHLPSSYQCLELQTPPPSPHRPPPRRRRFTGTQGTTQQAPRVVKSGRIEKSHSIIGSPSSPRFPCNDTIYVIAADGTKRPVLDAKGNPKVCNKTFQRAEHLTRHKKTHDPNRMASDTFCPIPDCKKSKDAANAFGGDRKDNLVDHFKKTHCQESDHNGRNRRITRTEAEVYGTFWAQVWDAAQPDQKLKELARIWKPHADHDQDPHKVLDFFMTNDLRLNAAQLRKRLNHPELESRILNLLPPRGRQRLTKTGKCRNGGKRVSNALS